MATEGDRMLAGRYRVGALLGQGGSACVFDGYDTRLERPVAIKQLRPEVAAHIAMRHRFEQEARTAARLSHPNAVAVYDTGEDGGQTYLVMERLPGRTLADCIARGPMPPAEVAAVGGDVLGALRAAHALGMVHRDVKPGNVLLTDDGQAKVGDFGIAKSIDPLAGGTIDDPTVVDPTVMGQVIGTPAYLAPERLAGHPATARADLFSLGVVLFEALTGRKPGPSPSSVPGAPPALAAVVLRALAPRPEDRYASASEMAGALHTAAADLPSNPAPTAFDGALGAQAPAPAVRAPGAPVDAALAGTSLAHPTLADAVQPDATILPGVGGAVPGAEAFVAARRADDTALVRTQAVQPPLRVAATGGWHRWRSGHSERARRSLRRWGAAAATWWRSMLRRRPVALGMVMGLTGVGLLVVALSGSATSATPTSLHTASSARRSPATSQTLDRSRGSGHTSSTTTTTTAPPVLVPTTQGTLAPAVVSHDKPGPSTPNPQGAGDGGPAASGPGGHPGQGGPGHGGPGGGGPGNH